MTYLTRQFTMFHNMLQVINFRFLLIEWLNNEY